jgi:ATP-binding cassette subfamily F protein 3
MLYQIKNGALELGGSTILSSIDFEIRDREKIAIVGRNGCGKTSLLKLLSGEYELTKSQDTIFAKSGKIRLGYLKQNAFENYQSTVDEEMQGAFTYILDLKAKIDTLIAKIEQNGNDKDLERLTFLQEEHDRLGGAYYEKDYNLLFGKFGFKKEDKQKRLCEFSGGQLTKLAFIKLLLEKPDVLLLDEPTNHLDIETTEWLEGYLKEYRGAVVIVSHDRRFLDKISDVVYEIEYGKTRRYVGNYTSFVKQKEADYDRQMKEYKAQQAEIARLNALIERFRDTPTKVSMTDSKLKAIEHMHIIEEPRRFDTDTFKAHFTPNRATGQDVLMVNNLEIGYDKPICKVSFKLHKNQKIGIIGPNGIGKSTLVKTLVGKISALGGSFNFGYNVDVGYYDQQMIITDSTKTVLDELWDEFPKLSQTEVRSILGAFMFTKDDVFKTVDMLSGGEKVRLALCKILQRKPNFLILDEPTNHMDMIGKDSLEKMLESFEGSILFVSHDRYFVNKIASSLIVFDENGATHLDLTYDEYVAKKADGVDEITTKPEKEAPPKEQTKAEKSYNQSKERARAQRRLEKINTRLAEIDAQIEEKREFLSTDEVATNYVLLCQLNEEIEALENEMLTLLEEAEELENLLK